MLLLTGFGPFLTVTDNPSGRLVAESGLPHHILEVSYSAVDLFVDQLDPSAFDQLLMVGVATQASRMRVELVARNWIGETADVRGQIHGPSVIDPAANQNLAGTLWSGQDLLNEGEGWAPSIDAGSYLCNYIYFRALQRFPNKAVGFLHVPPYDAMPLGQQTQTLGQILELLLAERSGVLSRAR